jgi:hypothetical protein
MLSNGEKALAVVGGILLSPFIFIKWVLEGFGILKKETHEYPEVNKPLEKEEE